MAQPPPPPASAEELRQAILARYDSLSKRLQQIARYVLDEPNAVALETLARRTGIKLVHVPYKAPPGPDVISGAVSLYLEASTTAIPTIRAGRIKALAVSGTERIPSLPDVPTITEYRADLDPNGVIGNSWHGIFTPAGTPDDIVAKLNTEIVKIVKTAEIQERMRSLALTPSGTPASVLAADVSSDFAYWGKLVRDLGIKFE